MSIRVQARPSAGTVRLEKTQYPDAEAMAKISGRWSFMGRQTPESAFRSLQFGSDGKLSGVDGAGKVLAGSYRFVSGGAALFDSLRLEIGGKERIFVIGGTWLDGGENLRRFEMTEVTEDPRSLQGPSLRFEQT